MVSSDLRQLRRVRWGVRFTLVLGISASLAANVLHASHLLIDQIIAGWPPVAVFATIEAIARVPMRRRWLAAIRMTGLGFVAGIAFWVSYWHMAAVAAVHGEDGSKYLLPLSVDGLVVVASVSLVELTGQISAVEAAARVAIAAVAAEPPPAPTVAPAPPVAVTGATPALAREPSQPDRVPAVGAGARISRAATATGRAGRGSAGVTDGSSDPRDATAAATRARGNAPSAAKVVDATGEQRHDGLDLRGEPPDSPGEAVLWWRAKDPTLTLSQIGAKVGRSERTVRRVLDHATTGTANIDTAPPAALASSGQPTGSASAPGIPVTQRGTNGAAVTDLADQVVAT